MELEPGERGRSVATASLAVRDHDREVAPVSDRSGCAADPVADPHRVAGGRRVAVHDSPDAPAGSGHGHRVVREPGGVAPRPSTAPGYRAAELELVLGEGGPGPVRLSDRVAQPALLAEGDPVLEPADPRHGERGGAVYRLGVHGLVSTPGEHARGIAFEQGLGAGVVEHAELDRAGGAAGCAEHDRRPEQREPAGADPEQATGARRADEPRVARAGDDLGEQPVVDDRRGWLWIGGAKAIENAIGAHSCSRLAWQFSGCRRSVRASSS